MGCCGSGHLGLFDARTCGHGVGAHLYGFLGLLRGLGRVLTLNESLLGDPRRLVRRDGFATFEGPGTGAAGGQQGDDKPGAQKRGDVLHGGRAPLV